MSHDDLIKFKSNNNAILDLKRKISFAKGHERVDLVVKNAKIVNVFSGEIHQTDVAIADGIFVGFGEEGYNTKNLYDAGLYDEGQCNNPHYHSSDDLPSDLDMGYITSITKLIVATILKEARSGGSSLK